jgi:hypothetical protein
VPRRYGVGGVVPVAPPDMSPVVPPDIEPEGSAVVPPDMVLSEVVLPDVVVE